MVYVKRVPIPFRTKDPEKVHHKCHKNMTGIINSLEVITPSVKVENPLMPTLIPKCKSLKGFYWSTNKIFL